MEGENSEWFGERTISDFVRVFDGDRYSRKRLLTQVTEIRPSFNVSSLGSQMLVVFDSDYQQSNQGFKANILFKERNPQNETNHCTADYPCDVSEGPCHNDEQCSGHLQCIQNACPQGSGNEYESKCCFDYCGQFLDMNSGLLDYYKPHGKHYPDLQKCSWLIKSSSNETITLEFFGDFFVSFPLYVTSNILFPLRIVECFFSLMTGLVMTL